MSWTVIAETPHMDGTTLIGRGGRECEGPAPGSATIRVLLRRDIKFWPDKTLAEEEKVSSDFLKLITVKYSCHGLTARKVYTEARTNTDGKAQSPRVNVNCG